jgi:dipeptidyl aminopeptidase/acylaminoacyl peptidase
LDCGVAYSPDGRRIAYTGSRFFERDAEIYTINVDGSHRTKVTDNNSIDYWPSYSPNGKKIAYLRSRGLNPDIYTKNVGGGGKSNKVTDGRYMESNPSWGEPSVAAYPSSAKPAQWGAEERRVMEVRRIVSPLFSVAVAMAILVAGCGNTPDKNVARKNVN